MKKFIVVLTFMMFAIAPVGAQTLELVNEEQLAEEAAPAETASSQALNVSFRQGLQDPATKNVTFEMVIDSKVTSDRVRVTWEVKGVTTFIDETELVRNLIVKEGERYVVPFTVRPLAKGVSEVYGTARIVGADASQIATVRKNFATNEYADILPITDEYKQAQVLNIAWQVGKVVIGVVFFLLIAIIGFKKFVRWYKTDEREKYEKKATSYK